jgi:hypothetical protein
VLYLPMTSKVKQIVPYGGKNKIRYTQDKDGVVVHLGAAPTDIDYILDVQTK